MSCTVRRPLAASFSGGHLPVHPNSLLCPCSVQRPLSLTCLAVLRSLKVLLPLGDTPPAVQAVTRRGLGLAFRSAAAGPGTPGATVWWRVVASTDGICGSLTGGHLSNSDSRESRRCGFRPLRGRAAPVVFLLGPVCRSPGVSLTGAFGACGGPGFGETSGGIMDGLGGRAWYAGPVCRGRVSLHLFHGSPSAFPPSWRGRAWGRHQGCVRAPGGVSPEGRIWLILPVVICLSQRLSHACLSISTLLL
jgi:hypothetical protein